MLMIKLLSYYFWKKLKNSRDIKKIFAEIKEELKRICKESDDVYSGLTESDIIKKYAYVYGYTEIQFQRQIMPKLRTMREKDESIKEFEEIINGKIQRLWQWSFY